MMGKPRGVTHSTVWPDLEMSLALSVSQSCKRTNASRGKVRDGTWSRRIHRKHSKHFTNKGCEYLCVVWDFKIVFLWISELSSSTLSSDQRVGQWSFQAKDLINKNINIKTLGTTNFSLIASTDYQCIKAAALLQRCCKQLLKTCRGTGEELL